MRSNNTFKPHLVRPTSSNCSKITGSETNPEHSVYATDGEQQQQTGNADEHKAQEENGLSSDRPNPPDDSDDQEVEGEKSTKIIRSPGTPSAKERQEHEVHHWPYRSWCDHCVKGRALGQPHRTVKGEYAESSVARVLMDYGYLHEEETVTTEEHGQKVEAKISMTAMVMLETMCSSVWAYAIDAKGSSSLDWLARQVVSDLETVGLSQERIIVKSDQEPSIVQLQKEIARQRGEASTGIENSRVGDSDSNGRIERAIREVKGLIRTLRSSLEANAQTKIKLDDSVVPWIVRHAAYIITRCRIDTDGKTAMQKVKGRKVNTPLVPFGETVLFKLPKVMNMPGDFQDRFESGVWLGCTVRSGEHLIGTTRGVYKVSSVMRRAEDKRWSSEMIKGIQGSPMEPVPGSGTSRITAFAKTKERIEGHEVRYAAPPDREEPEIRTTYIFKRDIEKYGQTEGCPGCRAAMNPASSFRAKHTQECRNRIEGELKKTEEGRRRVERTDERMNNAVAKKFEEIIEGKEESGKKRPGDSEAPGDKPTGFSSVNPGGKASSSKTEEVDSDMKADAAPPQGEQPSQGEQAQLEEAPVQGSDRRVPMDPRAPAQKRGRDPQSPKGPSKWQAFEKETNKRDHEPEPASDAKFQAVEDTAKPADAVERAKDQRSGVPRNGSKANLVVQPMTSVLGNGQSPSSAEGARGETPPPLMMPEIRARDLTWRDIGSGTFARTFKGARKLTVSTHGGPPASEVHRRTVYCIRTNRLIDDCVIDDTCDEDLYRSLDEEMDIRVELTLKDALDLYKKEGADVVEVFSPPRIAQESAMKPYGGTDLKPGWSLDLTRTDPKTGKAWDLSDPSIQRRIKKLVRECKPLFLIGSPPCTAFSVMQNLNRAKRDPKVVEKEMNEARGHMLFCIELYKMQIRAGRYFIHEHPEGASSWHMRETIELLMDQDVGIAQFDMCQYGMTVMKDGKEHPVQKSTRVASNSREVLKRLNRRCPNKGGEGARHAHVQLEGGMTKSAQIYPREFCKTVCEGIAAEKRLRALGMEAWTIDEVSLAAEKLCIDERYGKDPSKELHEEDVGDIGAVYRQTPIEDGITACDDQSGEPLKPEMVRVARREEMQYFKAMNVYKKVPIKECWDNTGKAPIGVRWVDINKGDSTHPNYRSRLVAKEFKTDEKPEWYAATPPSECLKILLSKAAANRNRKIAYADVSRAYFYAKASRAVYVELPDEDKQEGDEGICGRLNVSMYGTRDAALNWSEEYAETLKVAGFRRGITNPCLFWNPKNDVTVMVHGDDFVAVGEGTHLESTTKALRDKYKIKVEVLGGDKGEAKEIKILNKVIRLTKEGLELEADPRHAELVVRALGLEKSKACATPGVKEAKARSADNDEEEVTPPAKDGLSSDRPDLADDEEDMGSKEATMYRAVVARLNYIAPDRIDIQYAVKEAARAMSAPKQRDWKALMRIGRYMLGKPRLIMKFEWQAQVNTVSTYSDSDWAGCRKTGRSTSGGVVTMGKHTLKSYSRQQKTIALSSAEAELHAMVAASSETIGLRALCRDMGLEAQGDVYVDSSAAIGISQRVGSGKVRHVRVQALWVQEIKCNKRLKYMKVLGTRNPSDILTKHVPKDLLETHLQTLGVVHQAGRSKAAPTLDSVEAYTTEWKDGTSMGLSSVSPGDVTGLSSDRPSTSIGAKKRRKVTFYPVVSYRCIPAEGNGRKVASQKATEKDTGESLAKKHVSL